MLAQWIAIQNLNYQQCNTHWRQIIRLHAASSGATKDFILHFIKSAVVLPKTYENT